MTTTFHSLRHFRRSVLDHHADLPCRVLEIGAFSEPTVDPSEAQVKFLDFHATEELRSMARTNGADPASVVAVDYVCRTDDYTQVVDETFDLLVANHVLEHIDRTIDWLQMLRTLLRDGGLLFLVLPDKKQSFDRFRPDTPLSHLLYEHLAPDQDASSVHNFESALYYDLTYVGEENNPAIMRDMERLAKSIVPSHPGVHRHVFQFETFREKIMKPLLYTGLLDFALLEIRNCPQLGEFAVVLRAGRDDGPADPGGLFHPAADSLLGLDALAAERAESRRLLAERREEIKALVAERAESNRLLAERHDEIMALVAERAENNRLLAERHDEIMALVAERAENNRLLAERHGEIMALVAERAESNRLLDKRHGEIMALVERLEAVWGSWSWRLTRPLRALRRPRSSS